MKKIAFISLVLLGVAACNKATDGIGSSVIKVKADISATKVAYDGNKSAFEASDNLSLFVWTGDKTVIPSDLVVNNVTNTLGDDGLWVPDIQMLWKDMVTPHYFMAVSPARTVTSFTADPYFLDSSADRYQQSDLLIAVNDAGLNANDNPVQLTFDHAMAKLNVRLAFRNQWTEQEDLPGDPNVEAKVANVTALAKDGATINYIKKAVTAIGYERDILLNRITNASWTTLMVPQKGFRTISIFLSGNDEWLGGNGTYVFKSASDIKLESGKITTVNLIVGRDQITLDEDGISITDWEDGTVVDNGEAQIPDNSFIEG